MYNTRQIAVSLNEFTLSSLIRASQNAVLDRDNDQSDNGTEWTGCESTIGWWK